MFILHQFPDPRRLVTLSRNESYRRQFYGRWGKEHCIVLAASRRIEFPPFTQRLSVKTVVNGAERYEIDARTLTLDEDHYWIVNDGRTYASCIAADRAVETFSIFFAPGFAESVVASVLRAPRDLLNDGAAAPRRGLTFSEHLRPHDQVVTPVLRRIRHRARLGERSNTWYEEQFVLLLEAMVRSQQRTSRDIVRLPFARPATRHEVYRRIALATDYLHGNYRRNLGLDELARASHLSKYHFIRLFEIVHGRTPHAFLRHKRAAIAKRLLVTTRLPHMEVALLAGFASRSTMFREIRRLAGVSGRRVRSDARHECRTADRCDGGNE